LYDCVKFYRVYPRIVRTVSAQLAVTPEKLVSGLSYSQLKLLVDIDEDLKRAFYEIECLRGNWSVRELKRQIGSLYFERSGLSRDKRKLARLVRAGVEQAEPKLAIRDPYVFEFLGLRSRETMSESDLEDALLETPLERRAPDFVGTNARSDGPATKDESGRSVSGRSVPL